MPCPFIDICDAPVTYEQYRMKCMGTEYVNCLYFIAFRNEQKTPKEWKELEAKTKKGELP